MPYIAGVYKRPYSWVADNAAGKNISPVEFDLDGDDVATALTNCVLRDGTGAATADIPMAGHALTGLRAGAAPGESATFDQMNTAIAVGQTGSNNLQNSNFAVNQRAVSGTVTLAAGAYGHDRWKAGASGCTYTFSKTGLDTTLSILAGSLLQITQAEDIVAGVYTLSQDGGATAQARIYQSSGGAYSNAPITTGALTEATAIVVEFTGGTILRPQLVVGSVAQPYRRRPYSIEYMLCRAYYEIMTFAASGASGGNNPLVGQGFAVRKMAVPTIIVLAGGQSFTVNVITRDYINGNIISPGGSGYLSLSSFIAASCEP